jgi:hypothetical protein
MGVFCAARDAAAASRKTAVSNIDLFIYSSYL